MTDERYIFLVFASSYQQLLVVNRKQPQSGTQETSICKARVCFFSSENHFYLNNYLENNKCVALKTFLYPPSSFPHPNIAE